MSSIPSPFTSARGTLEVICGPMFAGKTTMLMERIRQARVEGMAVGVFRPARDTRSNPASIQTHAGVSLAATEIDAADEVLAGRHACVMAAIDEAHFFAQALLEPCLELRRRGSHVLVAGVDLDHRGRMFEPFVSLIPHADRVHRLQGTCARCGKPSTHTQRLVEEEGRILVGGDDLYEARCAACFKPPKERVP
jgi:thymidine kinase